MKKMPLKMTSETDLVKSLLILKNIVVLPVLRMLKQPIRKTQSCENSDFQFVAEFDLTW